MPDNKHVSPLAASAKINLTLSVTGRNEAGYHQLVSAVGFTRFADKLHLTKAPEMSLEIAGPFAANLPGNEADNLILSAHRLANNFAKKSGLMLADSTAAEGSALAGDSAAEGLGAGLQMLPPIYAIFQLGGMRRISERYAPFR